MKDLTLSTHFIAMQYEIRDHIKQNLRGRMEQMSLADLAHYEPEEYTVLPDVLEELEEEGYNVELLESDQFYEQLKKQWDDLLGDWLREEKRRLAYNKRTDQ